MKMIKPQKIKVIYHTTQVTASLMLGAQLAVANNNIPSDAMLTDITTVSSANASQKETTAPAVSMVLKANSYHATLPKDIANLLDIVFTLELNDSVHESLIKLYQKTLGDPVLAESVSVAFLEKIKATNDQNQQETLYSWLEYIPSEAVTEHALELLSANDNSRRIIAYRLLSQSAGVDPMLVLDAFEKESDPEMAQYALAAIGNRKGPIARQYSADVQEALSVALNKIYLSHQAPSVQAIALRSLASLNKASKGTVQSAIDSALDSDINAVKYVAIDAVVANQLFSDKNKSKLLTLAKDEQVDATTFYVVYDALSRGFLLKESEKQRLFELKLKMDAENQMDLKSLGLPG